MHSLFAASPAVKMKFTLLALTLAVASAADDECPTCCSHTTCEMKTMLSKHGNGMVKETDPKNKVMVIYHSNDETKCHKHADTHTQDDENKIKWDVTGNKVHCKMTGDADTDCQCAVVYASDPTKSELGSLIVPAQGAVDPLADDTAEYHGKARVHHDTGAGVTPVVTQETVEQEKTNTKDPEDAEDDRVLARNALLNPTTAAPVRR